MDSIDPVMTLVPLNALLPEPIILLFVGTIMLALGNMQRRATTLTAEAKTAVSELGER
jgi:hypothetical protein